jgi:hypothetical protein
MRTLAIAFGITTLIMSAGLAAQDGAFDVSATLTHAGETFASPAVSLRADQPASVEVFGDGAFKLTLTVTDVAPNKIRVQANLDSEYGSMEPIVVVRPGEPASVSVGDLAMEVTVSRSGG